MNEVSSISKIKIKKQIITPKVNTIFSLVCLLDYGCSMIFPYCQKPCSSMILIGLLYLENHSSKPFSFIVVTVELLKNKNSSFVLQIFDVPKGPKL